VRVEERVRVTRYCAREDRSADTRTAKSACAAAESAAVRGVRAVSWTRGALATTVASMKTKDMLCLLRTLLMKCSIRLIYQSR
jgi:hypothetical protein